MQIAVDPWYSNGICIEYFKVLRNRTSGDVLLLVISVGVINHLPLGTNHFKLVINNN